MGWELGKWEVRFSDGWQLAKRFTASIRSSSKGLEDPDGQLWTLDTQTTSVFGKAPPSSGWTTRSPGRMRHRSGSDPTYPYPKQLIPALARSGRTICFTRGGGHPRRTLHLLLLLREER